MLYHCGHVFSLAADNATTCAWHPQCPYGTSFMPDHIQTIFGAHSQSPGVYREFSIWLQTQCLFSSQGDNPIMLGFNYYPSIFVLIFLINYNHYIILTMLLLPTSLQIKL